MDYQPINCDFHDVLLAHATLRREVTIVYLEDGEEVAVRSRIKDVYTRDKAEYAVLETGTTVRLDRLISVGGVAPGGQCGV